MAERRSPPGVGARSTGPRRSRRELAAARELPPEPAAARRSLDELGAARRSLDELGAARRSLDELGAARQSLRERAAAAFACTLCAHALPHGPRPVFRVDTGARVVIIGQAPGARVHESGVPWQDDSGDRLLDWLGIDRATFDDPSAFAILPMGFCWPGRRAGGDLPPRPECAPAWHDLLLDAMPRVSLRLLVGQYAHARYLGHRASPTLTETVRRFAEFLPAALPLPHPSWRSRLWIGRNPWFERELLPVLRRRIAAALASDRRA